MRAGPVPRGRCGPAPAPAARSADAPAGHEPGALGRRIARPSGSAPGRRAAADRWTPAAASPPPAGNPPATAGRRPVPPRPKPPFRAHQTHRSRRPQPGSATTSGGGPRAPPPPAAASSTAPARHRCHASGCRGSGSAGPQACPWGSAQRFGATPSVDIAARPSGDRRAGDDPQVHAEGPMLDVVQVVLDAVVILRSVSVWPRNPLTCAQPVMPGLTRWRIM